MGVSRQDKERKIRDEKVSGRSVYYERRAFAKLM